MKFSTSTFVLAGAACAVLALVILILPRTRPSAQQINVNVPALSETAARGKAVLTPIVRPATARMQPGQTRVHHLCTLSTIPATTPTAHSLSPSNLAFANIIGVLETCRRSLKSPRNRLRRSSNTFASFRPRMGLPRALIACRFARHIRYFLECEPQMHNLKCWLRAKKPTPNSNSKARPTHQAV
jgi:hypothetical protein